MIGQRLAFPSRFLYCFLSEFLCLFGILVDFSSWVLRKILDLFTQGGNQVGFFLEEFMAKAVFLIALLVLACGIVSAQEDLEQVIKRNGATEYSESGYFTRIISFLKQSRDMLSKPIWPVRYSFYILF